MPYLIVFFVMRVSIMTHAYIQRVGVPRFPLRIAPPSPSLWKVCQEIKVSLTSDQPEAGRRTEEGQSGLRRFQSTRQGPDK